MDWDALLDGVDYAVNYINGYVAASNGKPISDYTNPSMPTAAIRTVWWRGGWKDHKAGNPMNPQAFARQRRTEITFCLKAA